MVEPFTVDQGGFSLNSAGNGDDLREDISRTPKAPLTSAERPATDR